MGDLLRNIADTLFHQGLVCQDHLSCIAIGNNVVHLAHVGDIQGGRTLLGVVHSLEHLHGGHERPHMLGIPQGGQAENKAISKRLQRKPLQITGMGHHISIEVVGEIP